MNDSHDGPSLDPRTWGKPAQPKPATLPPADTRASPEATSFDPKAWSLGPIPGGPETASPTAREPRRNSKSPIIVGAAVIALLIGGGGAWWLTTRPHQTSDASGPAGAPAADVQRRALTVSKPADIPGVLTSAGLSAAEATTVSAAALPKLNAGAGDLTVVLMLRPIVGGATLVSLDARHDDGAGVVVQAGENGTMVAQATPADLKTEVKVVRGEMDAYSFYSSAVAQHLTDSLISPFAQALAFDFDFQREIHAGDIFEAAFENRVNSHGASVGVGRLLYVSLETPMKSRALYWFQPVGGEPGWYDGNGASVVRALMRTPVESARISSTFGMREHPILGFMKMHKGTDFAAPIGTPIYAAGDGLIEFAGPKGPNGNFVKIKHDNGWETLYLHMSMFGPGITEGARVRQGQQVGAIGTTGRSTGPHLHYEVHINDEPVDPMSIKMEAGHPLQGPALQAFLKERDRIDALRASQTG